MRRKMLYVWTKWGIMLERGLKTTRRTYIKLVIVEDEISIAQMYKYKLELHGYDVQLAHNGIEGYKICESYRPDLILLDIMMPYMNGDEMLERMRATAWGSEPRVIILTNISKDEAPMKLRFLNVDRYIVKAHHTPQQVVDVVHEVLGEKIAKVKRLP